MRAAFILSLLISFIASVGLSTAHAQTNETESPISEPMRKLLADAKQIDDYLDLEIWDVRYSCKDPMELSKEGVFDSCKTVLESLKMHISDAINQSRSDIDKIKGAAYQ